MTDPHTGECYFLIGPKTLFSVFILVCGVECGRGRGGGGVGGAVGTIKKALVYELLLASLCKRLLVHFYLLFESEFLSTCKCWS